MENKNLDLVRIHIAVLLFGLAGLFARWVDQPSTLIVLGRVLFATLFLGVAIVYLRLDIRLKSRRDTIALLLLGVLLAVHWGTFFEAIRVSTVAVGLLTFSTFPVFVTFMEPLFFKEKLRLADIVTAVITFAGVALVIPRFQLGDSMMQGALWGTASGLTFALLSILNRKYARKYSSLVIAFYQDASAMVVLVPFVFIGSPVFRTKDVLLLALLGILFTAVAHTLFIRGLVKIKAQTASIITCLEPVYGIIAALFLLGEVPSPRMLAGGCIILGTAFYSTLKAGKA